jgi:O-antigen ligase
MNFNTTREKLFFFHIPSILFVLIPFFLITGPFLSDLAISLISILFLIYCIGCKNFSYFKNKYFIFFLFFWFYILFNSLFINFSYDSLKISLFYFRYGVFVIAVVALLNFDKKFIKYFFFCILICFSVLILDGFYQYFNGENFFGYRSINSSRTTSLFNDKAILGSYLSRLWPLFFGLSILISTKKIFFYFIFILIFILSEVLIFLSGDRTAFFYINLSGIFIIIFSQKLLKLRLFTLLTSIILLIVISLINPTAKERVFDKTFEQMNLIEVKEKKFEEIYIFSAQHTHHYMTSYKMFLDNKIFGVGIKNFRNLCSNEKYQISILSCSTHPHNTYVQILTETGIIGFSFLIFTLFFFIKLIFSHLILKFKYKHYFNDFEICILSGIAIYLWPIAPTGNVFNNWLTITFIIYLPFLFWSKMVKKT